MHGPDGKSIMHAELKIGDSIFMLSEESPEMNTHSPESIGGSPVGMYLYVKDVDSVFNRLYLQALQCCIQSKTSFMETVLVT